MGLPEPFLDHAPALFLGPFCVTRGSLACLTIFAKFLLSLGAALLLVATTRFDEVCVALGRLGVPRPLVRQLLLTYRYMFVLGEEAARLLRAHALRSPDHPRPTLRTAGVLLGQLLLRAVGRGERIHIAMRCRGFDGNMPMRREWTLGPGDAAFGLFTGVLLVSARAIDLSFLLGRTIMGGSP
jgi:cobalt/nickel transport system permease protein